MVRRLTRRPSTCWLVLASSTAVFVQPGTGLAKARSVHRSQPAHIKQSAPDVTGSIGKATEPTAKAESAPPASPIAPASTAAANDTLVPYLLPIVPRTRMRACGEQWQSKRMAGETGDDDWRDFAIKCLATSVTSSSRD